MLVGQSLAVKTMSDEILHWAFNTISQKPQSKAVALMLAGPSGHGKTFLAKTIGKILGIPYHEVDCSSAGNANEIFGLSGPYLGADRGSALNSFMRKTANKPAIRERSQYIPT